MTTRVEAAVTPVNASPGSPPPVPATRLAYVQPPPTLAASRQQETVAAPGSPEGAAPVRRYKASGPDDYVNYYAQTEGGNMGLRNVGNTCYFNSVMQALLHCPALVAAVTHSYLHRNPTLAAEDNRIAFLSLFVRLMRLQWEGSTDEISPHPLLHRVWDHNSFFRGYRQHDAQEFLRCALDMLQEALSVPVRYFHAWNARSLPPIEQSHDASNPPVTTPNMVSSAPLASPACNSPSVASPSSTSKSNVPAPPRPPPQCVVSDLFQGELVSEVKCRDCGYISTTRETFLDLSLELPPENRLNLIAAERGADAVGPIKTGFWANVQSFFGILPPLTLETCLHSFCTGDDLSQGNQYRCDRCKKKVDAVKHISIAHLPEVLTVQIKRFQHTATSSYKLTQAVTFKETLDMQPYVHPEHPLAATTSAPTSPRTSNEASMDTGVRQSDSMKPSTEYQLFAVIRHSGSVSGGHYVCYAKNHVTGKWYCHDDDDTSQVSVEKVLSQEAYLLFYIRTPCLPAKRRALDLIAQARRGVQAALAQEKEDLVKWYQECAAIRRSNPRLAGREPLPGPGPCQSQLLLERIKAIQNGTPTRRGEQDLDKAAVGLKQSSQTAFSKKNASNGKNGKPSKQASRANKQKQEMKSGEGIISDSDDEVLASYGVDTKEDFSRDSPENSLSIFPPMPPSRVRYLSRLWLRKIETLSTPVPIDNRDLCCVHGVPDGMLDTDVLLTRAQEQALGKDTDYDLPLSSHGLLFAEQQTEDPRAILVTAEGYRQLVEELGELPDIHSHSHEPFLSRIPSLPRVLSRSGSDDALPLTTSTSGQKAPQSGIGSTSLRRQDSSSGVNEAKVVAEDDCLMNADDALFVDDFDAAQSRSGSLLSPQDTLVLGKHAERLATRVSLTNQPTQATIVTQSTIAVLPSSWPLTLVGPIVDGRRRHCPLCYTGVRRERDRELIALDKQVKTLLTDHDPYFIVNKIWLEQWRKYMSDPKVELIPGPITNEVLLATWPLPQGSNHSPNEILSPEVALNEFGITITAPTKRKDLQNIAVAEAKKYPSFQTNGQLIPPPRPGLDRQHYTALSACVFRAMVQRYGGGPEIPRATLNLYDTSEIDPRFDPTTGLMHRTPGGHLVSKTAWQRYLKGELTQSQAEAFAADNEDQDEYEDEDVDETNEPGQETAEE